MLMAGGTHPRPRPAPTSGSRMPVPYEVVVVIRVSVAASAARTNLRVSTVRAPSFGSSLVTASCPATTPAPARGTASAHFSLPRVQAADRDRRQGRSPSGVRVSGRTLRIPRAVGERRTLPRLLTAGLGRRSGVLPSALVPGQEIFELFVGHGAHLAELSPYVLRSRTAAGWARCGGGDFCAAARDRMGV